MEADYQAMTKEELTRLGEICLKHDVIVISDEIHEDLVYKEYTHIHEIGYRSMPEEMYLDWLVSLKTERSKYEDTRMSK